MSTLRLFKRIFRPERGKAELQVELDAHLAMAIADRVSRGEEPAQARQAALREMGSLPLIEDTTRAKWGWEWLDHLRQDLRYALRQIKGNPRFAATVVGTLALGIGAAAAMFTVVDHTLLQSLPFAHFGRLVKVDETDPHGNAYYGVTYSDFQLWRGENHAFQSMAYYTGFGARAYLGGSTSVQQVTSTRVGPGILKVLGVQPQLGHGFTKNDPYDSIILSYALWHLRYANDPNILGKTVQINGKPYTIIGVMPRGFEFPRRSQDPQVWMPVQLTAADYTRSDSSPGYKVIARLRPGVTAKAAQAEMMAHQKAITPLYSDIMSRQDHSRVAVHSFASTLETKAAAHALLILLAATGVLWLIACLNVMNLLLARAAARQREIAMQGALGASRLRILQQLLAEALLLSTVAAFLGAGFAEGVVQAFGKAITAHLAVWHPLALNLPVLGALVALTVVTALLASAWPAIAAAFAPIEPALRQNSQSGFTRRHYRLRALLVVVQIAMSLVLLVSCGLLLRTLYALRHVSLGFRTDHIVVAHLAAPAYRYVHRNMTADLYDPLLERVRHLPGVQAAGLMSQVPLGDTLKIEFRLYTNVNGVSKDLDAEIKSATPGLQRVFAFHMLAGRYFNASDTPTSRPVAIVNRAFARLYSPDPNNPAKVVGKRIMKLQKGGPIAIIVGVLDDIHQDSIEKDHQPEVVIPLTQLTPASGFYSWESWSMDLAARTHLPLKIFLPELRRVLKQSDPALANSKIETMDQIVAESYGSQTLAAHVLEFFGATALLLCISGLYGLLAYMVAQRRKEIGVRMALGAPREAVQRLVLKQAVWMIVPGVLLGAVLSWVTAHLVRSYVYGVSAHDHWTLLAAILLLLTSGLAAAWLPAARAASVQPAEAIREE